MTAELLTIKPRVRHLKGFQAMPPAAYKERMGLNAIQTIQPKYPEGAKKVPVERWKDLFFNKFLPLSLRRIV